ncbi:hypothetical protein EAH74_11510 [Pseudomonas mandelii]|uniref:Uncharacterized protein n=1 Tax=Pseudomonas mandelii TaxID=75612 RepID=A0A502IHK5_9PSED|nr:hypothetical protein EAH74_11510 [Pseudomonas mandelii]
MTKSFYRWEKGSIKYQNSRQAQTQISNTLRSNVGASLLAKAVCQATMMPTDTPFSRAGSLPQGIFGDQTRSVRVMRSANKLPQTITPASR